MSFNRKSFVHYRIVELCEQESFYLSELSTIIQNECGILLEKDGSNLSGIASEMINDGFLVETGDKLFFSPPGAKDRWIKKYGNPTPCRVHFDITYDCNLYCPHCYKEAQPTKNNRFLNKNLADAFVGQFAKVKPFLIEISGGEPTLVSNLKEFLKIVKLKLGSKIKLSTNGYLLNSEDVVSLSELIDTVNISIDGFERDHDSFRGVFGSFEKAVWATKAFLNSNVNVTVATMITSFNNNYLYDFIKFVSKLRVHNLRFAPLQRVGRSKSRRVIDKFGLTPTELRRVYKDLAGLRESYKTINIETRDEMYGLQHIPFKHLYQGILRYIHCGIGRSLVSINPFGDVVPCDFADEPELILGNILKDDFLELWDENEFYKKFRKKVAKGYDKCRSCENYVLCGGGLLCNSYNSFGTFEYPDPLCPFASADADNH